MPWHLEKRGAETCVIKDADSSVEKCHPTEAAAKAHMRALYANVEEASMDQPHAMNFVALAAEEIDGEGRQWIEILPTADKVKNGSQLFSLTEDDLNVYAESIRSKSDSIPVDFDHSYQEGKGTLAAGWFTGQAEVRQTENGPRLAAEVKWTPGALEAIRDRLYRFISAEFSLSEQDAKTGLLTKAKAFYAATLTNRPFFKELAAVASEQRDPWLVEESEKDMLAEEYGEEGADLISTAAAETEESEERGSARGLIFYVAAADPKKPYGDVTYADPGYQEDGKKRYPLDTETHIRAAWSYINQAGNATKYSAEQLARIKARIRAAMKRIGADVSATNEGEDNMDAAVIEALGLPDDASEEDVFARIKENQEAAAKAAEQPKKTTRRKDANMAELSAIAEALGLEPGADEATVLATINQNREAAEKLDSTTEENEGLRVLAEKQRKTEAKLAVVEAERKQERVRHMLDEGVRDGRVIPAEKTVLAKQYASNPDGLHELLESRPSQIFRLTALGSGNSDEDFDEDLIAVRKTFHSEEADEVDAESGRLHIRAEQYLREQGIRGAYTEEQYLTALEAVAAVR
jgi:phage I-like protein